MVRESFYKHISHTWRVVIPGWIVLVLMLSVAACEEPLIIYVKARNPEELKTHAYESCGRHYRVISHEDDTALIECLKPLNDS